MFRVSAEFPADMKSAQVIDRLLDAYAPWPGSFVFLEGSQVYNLVTGKKKIGAPRDPAAT